MENLDKLRVSSVQSVERGVFIEQRLRWIQSNDSTDSAPNAVLSGYSSDMRTKPKAHHVQNIVVKIHPLDEPRNGNPRCVHSVSGKLVVNA